MASTYSPYKIQYMATGEDDGTWGDITNQNFTAFSDMINGQAAINFASADVVLTLTDTNAFQAARCFRLVCSGVSGGARNLTVPAIPKQYLVWNGLADLVTVKTPAGTGIAIPSGRSALVYCDGTNVNDEVTYTSNLFTGDVVSSGNVFSQALYFNNQTGVLNGDATVNNLVMGVAKAALFQTTKATGDLAYYVGPDILFNNNGANGDMGIKGNFFVRGTSLSVGASNLYQLTNDGANANITFNAANPFAYFQYNLASQTLQYVSNGVSNMTLDANGNMAVRGRLSANGLDLPSNSLGGNVLQDNTVPGSKLQDNTVTLSKWRMGESFIATNGSILGLYKDSTAQAQSRFIMGLFTAESGGNVGSDFFINCNDDTGNFIATPLTIQRKTGLVSANNGFTSVGAANFSSYITAQGTIQTLSSLYFGTPAGNQYLSADANSANLVFNPNCYLQYIKATGVFNFIVNSAAKVYFNGINGGFTAGYYAASGSDTNNNSFAGPGSIAMSGSVNANVNILANGSLYARGGNVLVGPNDQARLRTDGSTYSDVVWRQDVGSYVRYTWSSGVIQFVVNNGTKFQISGADGSVDIWSNINRHIPSSTGSNDTKYIDEILRWNDYVNNAGDIIRYAYSSNGQTNFPVSGHSLSGALSYYTNTPITYQRVSSGAYLSTTATLIFGAGGCLNFNNPSAGVNFGILNTTNGPTGRIMAFTKGDAASPPVFFDISTGISYGTSWSSTSDSRLKSDIQPVASGLDLLASLTPYTYKVATSLAEAAEGIGMPSAGVMAQDLIGTPLERLVHQQPLDEDGDFFTMDYSGLTAWYVAAFKEVKAKLDATEATLASVLARLDALEAK